jgi:iron complex transport system permease protein
MPGRDGRPGAVTSRRRRLLLALAIASALLLLAGLAAGGEGWSVGGLLQLLQGSDAGLIVGQIRAPRTLGAWLTGALLGLAGALAQGLFRNPLADPFLLGSASGASLAVVVVLAAGTLGAQELAAPAAGLLSRVGLVAAAFAGALGGVLLTLMLARGAQHTLRLLLAGVVVGVVLSALSDLLTLAAPEALRGRQVFMLGSTGLLGWDSCVLLAAGLALTLPLARRLSRTLDALVLGEDSAQSLGLALPRLRLALVCLLAAATGMAVSQAGLVAFVGLAAPHLVRRYAPGPHGYTLVASAAAGAVLLLAADVAARTLIAPQELPVGVLTAVFGGSYLLWLLNRQQVS